MMKAGNTSDVQKLPSFIFSGGIYFVILRNEVLPFCNICCCFRDCTFICTFTRYPVPAVLLWNNFYKPVEERLPPETLFRLLVSHARRISNRTLTAL